MTTAAHLITADELLKMGGIGRCELIRGELIKMAPAGAEHGGVAFDLGLLIGQYVRQHKLGRLFTAETGFTIERRPDTVRAPDIAFICKDRLQSPLPRRFWEGAPDLAVEVLSPGDTQREVRAKIAQWLTAGAISVWMVDPRNRFIEIHRRDNQVLVHRAGDEITNEPTLPGFVLKVDDVFTLD